jgi:hypothetical protein
LSKVSDIQKKYRGYVAATTAIRATKPEDVEVVYKVDKERPNYEGLIVYEPERGQIRIQPERGNNSYSFVPTDDVPALIKALREMFE